jgi:hypothetical protein
MIVLVAFGWLVAIWAVVLLYSLLFSQNLK